MRDFYAATAPGPLDQAETLRRLFAPSRQRLLPLVANPHVTAAGRLLDRVATALLARGRRVLVVDAASQAPLPHEMALLDLSACIETVRPQLGYLAARGLPLAHVDTRGSATGFLDAIADAAPAADVVLLHADATDLARLLMRRSVRPLLIGADHAESIKHAYAGCKLLAQRCSLMTFDLLLAADARSRRVPDIADSLGRCADGFLGAVLHDWAHIDPLREGPGDTALARLLAAQLALHDDASPARPAVAALHAN